MHPTYAQGDPNEGKPVLIDETFFDDLGDPYQCLGFTADGAAVTKWNEQGGWAHKYHGPFFSAKPVPAIEPCVCGGMPKAVVNVSTGPVRVFAYCHDCGRSGPHVVTEGFADTAEANPKWHAAIAVWNADQCALKLGRSAKEVAAEVQQHNQQKEPATPIAAEPQAPAAETKPAEPETTPAPGETNRTESETPAGTPETPPAPAPRTGKRIPMAERRVHVEGKGTYPLPQAAALLKVEPQTLYVRCYRKGKQAICGGHAVRWAEAEAKRPLPSFAPDAGMPTHQPDALLKQYKCGRCGTKPAAGKLLDTCPVCKGKTFIHQSEKAESEKGQ